MKPLQGLGRHVYTACVGFGGGACIGIVGWGGAQIIVPGMTHPIMALSQLSATGISLCSLSASTISGGFEFAMKGYVDFSAALSIAVPSVFSARLGTRLAARMSGDALSLVFNGLSVLLIPTHFMVQYWAFHRHDDDERVSDREPSDDPKVSSSSFPKRRSDEDRIVPPAMVQNATFGLLSGALSSLMGVGGLPLAVSYLTITADLPHHLVQGTALCSVIPGGVTSALSRMRTVPILSASAATAGSVLGGFCGAQVALWTSDERLRELYMLSLVLLGGRSAFAASRNVRNLLKTRKNK